MPFSHWPLTNICPVKVSFSDFTGSKIRAINSIFSSTHLDKSPLLWLCIAGFNYSSNIVLYQALFTYSGSKFVHTFNTFSSLKCQGCLFHKLLPICCYFLKYHHISSHPTTQKLLVKNPHSYIYKHSPFCTYSHVLHNAQSLAGELHVVSKTSGHLWLKIFYVIVYGRNLFKQYIQMSLTLHRKWH